MIGITALQRRILVLIYTLWRKDEEYQEQYPLAILNETDRDQKSLPAQDELSPFRTELSFV